MERHPSSDYSWVEWKYWKEDTIQERIRHFSYMRLVSWSTQVNPKSKSLARVVRLIIIVIIEPRILCLDYRVEYGQYWNFDHYQIP